MLVPLLSMVALAEDPTATGVVVTIQAYGEHLVGHMVVDADALAKLGITLKREDEPLTGAQIPLAHGTRIFGLPVGQKQVQDAVDTLAWFDGNKDGYLDAGDPAFGLFALWVDKDGDGRAAATEVRTLADIGVESISRFGEIRIKER